MPVKWTREQQQVIEARDQDLLVSAAAGSGKTAVLVERILKIITDEKKPVDIDRLLVVTFTNAAASEMRSRIRDALEERAEWDPDNIHLQRQLVLVHNAKIMTIHSFCLHVLRNHFQTVGIDPSFRIADEGEVLLMEQDAVKETVNEAYAELLSDDQAFREDDSLTGEEFTEFLEQYATGKSDANVEEAILQLYHFALGEPFPEEWLQKCRKAYDAEEAEASGASWIAFIEEDTRLRLRDVRGQLETALQLARDPDGPHPYEKALISDLEMVDQLELGKNFAGYQEAFRGMRAFETLGRKKDERISEEKRQRVLSMRGECKDQLNALRGQYYYDDPEALREEFFRSGVVVRVLTKLTEAFMQRLSKKKADRNILDFADMEHLALNALVTEELRPTAVALEYAETFEEVMIDEYQDSNLVQELILSSVSGKGRGAHNRFMVGDVKQSIYRFRLARPELFMEKYHSYRTAEDADEGSESETAGSSGRRIDLHRNFRSRIQVLNAVNVVFRRIMRESLGGIAYDADAALYPGMTFPGTRSGSEAGADGLPAVDWYTSELLILDGGADSSSADLREEEAKMVGRRIKELVGTMPVTDKESGTLRPAKYGDIVILLRTISGWGETFGAVLSDMGIPCFTGSQKGYFSAAEVRVVLSYLQILDNPLQDIPLAAVMRSPIGRFSDEELAWIRLAGEGETTLSFFDCCQRLLQAPREKNEELIKKLEKFFGTYQSLRDKCGHTPIHLLLWELLDATGYGEYAAALPAGRQRRANLDMLVEKAIAYESTSYRGLYHFVRYIENLQKYEIDYGEASLESESGDTVRIMSIHKSKGLEFPIVFVGGMGKQFNESDARSNVVTHPELGIACDCVWHTETSSDERESRGRSLPEPPRMRRATLLKKTIQQKISSENLGEELRVLYVAMTRAKEKLILTGAVKNLEKKLTAWSDAPLSYSRLSRASGYLDWVMPALMRHPDGQAFFKEYLSGAKNSSDDWCSLPPAEREASTDRERIHNGSEKLGEFDAACDTHFLFSISTPAENVMEDDTERTEDLLTLQELMNPDLSDDGDAEAGKYLDQVFSTSYPYKGDCAIPGKYSVSELKKLSQTEKAHDALEMYEEEPVVPLLPRFERPSSVKQFPHSLPSGAARGTAYHTFMENLDYSKEEDLRIQLEELISCGKMTEEEAASINLDQISAFLQSSTGRRMKLADKAGVLFREQPFVLGVPAGEIMENVSDEIVLVQGMIDAYFLENDQITLVDYKTDRMTSDRASFRKRLVKRYQTQIDYYAKALERLTGKKIRSRVIYSFTLGEEIFI